MRSIAYLLPSLPGLPAPLRTYAAWPVWRDSTRAEIRFRPLDRKTVVRWWHELRDFERQTRKPNRQDGAIGRSGLALMHTLMFDFLNHLTGRLDPSYAAMARGSAISERSVARGLCTVREAGVLGWQRRCSEGRDAAGRHRLEQDTNAYYLLPPSQWRGYRARRAAPPPQPGTWGDHPPLPELMAQAVDEQRHGAARTSVVQILEQDPGNRLAAALARFGRALEARDLLDCQVGGETVDKINNREEERASAARKS